MARSRFADRGAWVLGAPDVVLGGVADDVARRAEQHAAQGRRVLLLARSPARLDDERLPPGLEPAALKETALTHLTVPTL